MSANPARKDAAEPVTESRTVTIPNKLGLHLRPASQLVKLASRFNNCEITLSKDGQKVNAKSIMGVIMLAAECGSEIVIEATGDSCTEALDQLAEMIRGGFGEE